MYLILRFILQLLSQTNIINYQKSTLHISSSNIILPPQTTTLTIEKMSQFINTFQNIDDEEVELFIPQVLNIIIQTSLLSNVQPYHGYHDPSWKIARNSLEEVFYEKCCNNIALGITAYCVAKGMLDVSQTTNNIEYTDKLRYIQDRIVQATWNGDNPRLRQQYYHDYNFFLESLTRIGFELLEYNEKERNEHLRCALKQINSILMTSMLSRMAQSSYQTSSGMSHGHNTISPSKDIHTIAGICSYGLHFPLPSLPLSCVSQLIGTADLARYPMVQESSAISHAKEVRLLHPRSVFRILRIVESESCTLPSKEKCPFYVLVEVLEQGYAHNNTKLYEGYASDTSQDDEHADSEVNMKSNPCSYQSAANSLEVANHVRNFAVTPSSGDSNHFPLPTSLHLLETSAESISSPPVAQKEYRRPKRIPWTPTRMLHSQKMKVSESVMQSTENQHRYTNSLHNNLRHDILSKINKWEHTRNKIRNHSPYSALRGWGLRSFIVKSGDNIMKEVLAMQIIRIMENVFTEANIDIILRPYDILCTGAREGLVECINEGMSIDQIKKTILKSRAEHRGDKGTDTHITYPKIESLNVPQSNFKFDSQHRNVGMTGVAGQSEGQVSMKEIFEIYFGASYSPLYGVALQNFVKSLAGYSLVTYLLQVRDRHNGNILLDTSGRIVHVDYGYILGDSPGFNINFENVPFKLTKEYMDLLGGEKSTLFRNFVDLFTRGFFALRQNIDIIVTAVESFYGNVRSTAAADIRARLEFATTNADVMGLITDSIENWRTKQYDWFQQQTNNIL